MADTVDIYPFLLTREKLELEREARKAALDQTEKPEHGFYRNTKPAA